MQHLRPVTSAGGPNWGFRNSSNPGIRRILVTCFSSVTTLSNGHLFYNKPNFNNKSNKILIYLLYLVED